MTTVLITGEPGVGKTTCIRKIARSLEALHPIGFYTEEIREQGTRVGFELVSLNGRRMLLAHTSISTRYRVGKYHVDIAVFEEFLHSFTIPADKNSVIILDEIGKMECFSSVFRDMITLLMKGDHFLVATIAKRGDQFIEAVKRRDDIILFTVTKENRGILPQQILEKILVAGVKSEKGEER